MLESRSLNVAHSPSRCPFCHEAVAVETEAWIVCAACLARHHDVCWREAGRCATCSSSEALGRLDHAAASAPASPAPSATSTDTQPRRKSRFSFELTPVARAKALEYLRARGRVAAALRLTIAQDGRLGLEIDRRRDGDAIEDLGDVTVVFPEPFGRYLRGLKIDHRATPAGEGFAFEGQAEALNPERAREALRTLRSLKALRNRPLRLRDLVTVAAMLLLFITAILLGAHIAIGFLTLALAVFLFVVAWRLPAPDDAPKHPPAES